MGSICLQFAIAVTALVFMFSGATGAAQQARAPDLATIVRRMSQKQLEAHENQWAYEVTREYRFFEGALKPIPDSQVIADVTYFPPATKEFSIRNATGSTRGQRVVRKVLEHEAQMASNWRESAILEDNYSFSYMGEEALNGRRCFVLGLEPRRSAKELIKGRAWVDAKDYLVRQIQGEPARSPSFWIKKLSLTLLFTEVEGMWLQTDVHADAEVRIFGRNMLSEHDLNYRVNNAVAAKSRHRRSRPQANIGTFIPLD